MEEKTTPLHRVQQEAGASFVPFGDWLMPVRYSSDLAEHHAVRQAAGLFDVSHMAEFKVSGSQAGAFLDAVLSSTVSTLALGRAKYQLLLADTGGIIDDLLVYRWEEDSFLIVANAGNRASAWQALSLALNETGSSKEVQLTDLSDEFALLALQGPKAAEILAATRQINLKDDSEINDLKYYSAAWANYKGSDFYLARTGYTGEDGFELYLPVSLAEEIWVSLLQTGESLGLIPAGLAARDSLRLEAGMPLYGNELSLETTAAAAGLAKVVDASKGGKFALANAEPSETLIALRGEGRRAPRHGYPIMRQGQQVGVITSGALSPTLGYPIAFGYVSSELAESEDFEIDIRGTLTPATRVQPPFYKRVKR